jgi:hypothetical protein
MHREAVETTRLAAKVHLLEIDCEQANRFFIRPRPRGMLVRFPRDCETRISFFFRATYTRKSMDLDNRVVSRSFSRLFIIRATLRLYMETVRSATNT